MRLMVIHQKEEAKMAVRKIKAKITTSGETTTPEQTTSDEKTTTPDKSSNPKTGVR